MRKFLLCVALVAACTSDPDDACVPVDEAPYDGIDDDCDGDDLVDMDDDGFPGIHRDDWESVDAAWPEGLEAEQDCDDTDPDVYPDAPGEIDGDTVDTDCDGADDFD